MKIAEDWDTKLAIELRPYQKECLDLIEKRFSEGKSKLLVSIPTGGGKTLIFNSYSIVKDLRTLVIAHRDELLEQAIDKYVMLGGKIGNVGVVKAGEWRENRYTVASIQTLYRNLERVDGRKYDLVVVDEVHHLPSPTYRAVYDKLFETNPELKLLGVTATPFRSDRKDLSELFDDLAYAIDILELIRLGYLVPVRGRLVRLPVSLDALKMTRKDGEEDFSDRSISELFNKDYLNEEIVRKWKEYGEGRKTIFYLSSLEHAKALREAFLRDGVPAGYVDGKMSMEERRRVLRDFKEGRIKVLTNMNILTEGFDDPEVECIGIVRPTKSLTLYAQIVGRGLRIAHGKEDCLILDFTGISKKHTIVGLAELFGLPSMKEGLEKGEEVSVGAVENEDGERVIKVLIGEGTEEFTFEGKEASKYATRIGKDIVVSCGLNGKALLLKHENHLYDLYLITREEKKLLRKGLTEDYAWTTLTTVWKKEMDEFMSSYRDRAMGEPPTDKQIKYIERAIARGVIDYEDVPEEIDKLTATNLLAYIFLTTSPYQLNADVLVRIRDGKFVDEITGREVRLAHLKLFEEAGKKVHYPARCVKKAVEEKSVSPLEKWVFAQVRDVVEQVRELRKLGLGEVPIPFSWIESMDEERKEELRKWVRKNGVRVLKDERRRIYVFVFPPPFSELGRKLEEIVR